MDAIRAKRDTTAKWEAERLHYRTRCAKKMYPEMVDAIGEKGKFSSSVGFTSCKYGGFGDCHYFDFDTPTDLEFFKDYLEKESDYNVTCRIQPGDLLPLKCALKESNPTPLKSNVRHPV